MLRLRKISIMVFRPLTLLREAEEVLWWNPHAYAQVFADALIGEAGSDENVVAVHAAMGGGTGLNHFEKFFADRTFDVGIAEQHAVTFAAGLAVEGLKPMCTIYSTLQRGFDQVVHDVALQKLPVRFAMDRAGLVGEDGLTTLAHTM